MDPVIEVSGLWTVYGRQVVHRDIDLTVERGEVLVLVGGSGSGKTTLLRQMMRLETPTRGEVKVFGEPLKSATPGALRRASRRWGVLFQHGALFTALTVYDNIALPLRELKQFSEAIIRELVMLKLHLVGIGPEHAIKMPAQLSGGMVKRVALARALVLDPELLFLDEPTAGLDPDRSEAFVTLIQSLRQMLHLTVIMVTHDLDTLAALADRVAVLADHRLVVVGALPEVVKDAHPFIQNFFLGARGRRVLQAAMPPSLPIGAPSGAKGAVVA
jgi:phospholipid/cholesterol/gamma-HCH transport system ATP-binding protein